ncbi:MAG: diguanylate cyclase [Thiotrichaceae bacterium]
MARRSVIERCRFIAEKITKNTRIYSQATLARLGGDEFGLLLEECDLENAKKLAIHCVKRYKI